MPKILCLTLLGLGLGGLQDPDSAHLGSKLVFQTKYILELRVLNDLVIDYFNIFLNVPKSGILKVLNLIHLEKDEFYSMFDDYK